MVDKLNQVSIENTASQNYTLKEHEQNPFKESTTVITIHMIITIFLQTEINTVTSKSLIRIFGNINKTNALMSTSFSRYQYQK